MYKIFRFPCYDAPTDKGGAAPVVDDTDSLERDLADIGDEDVVEEKAEKAEPEEGDEKEDNEGDEKEEEEEADEPDPDEEKVEEDKVEASGRPGIKDITKKYPNLFKDFPALRSAFFLTPKFLEVFPDPESAQEASNKALEYDSLENSLVGQGDPSVLLKTLAQNNPKALTKIVENFGATLYSIDKDSYNKLATPIIEDLLYYASQDGTKQGNKNLTLAARHLANYVFANGGDIPDITKREGKKEPHPAEKELEVERATHATEKFHSAVTSIADKIDPEINQVIKAKLTDFSPFEVKMIVKEVRAELDDALKSDKAFQSQLRGLWKRAQDNGYSLDALSRIKSAWLERAKALAPGIRNRLRQEALDAKTDKGSSVQSGKKRSFTNSSGRAPSPGSSVGRMSSDPKKVDWRKTSDMDILNSK